MGIRQCTVYCGLYTAILENKFFYLLIIPSLDKLNFLHMLYRLQIVPRFPIPIGVVLLKHWTLPGCEISHTHRIFAAGSLFQHKAILYRHMVWGELLYFLRQQRRLHGRKRRKCPTRSKRTLIFNLRRALPVP